MYANENLVLCMSIQHLPKRVDSPSQFSMAYAHMGFLEEQSLNGKWWKPETLLPLFHVHDRKLS